MEKAERSQPAPPAVHKMQLNHRSAASLKNTARAFLDLDAGFCLYLQGGGVNSTHELMWKAMMWKKKSISFICIHDYHLHYDKPHKMILYYDVSTSDLES